MFRKLKYLTAVLFAILTAGYVQHVTAHLMVAQRGTLNITEKGIYLVLSLPASAFSDADDNADRQLQTSELLAHRLRVVEVVKREVVVLCGKNTYAIEGMMLTPVEKSNAQHTHSREAVNKSSFDANSTVIDQIIVMGRYPVICSDKKNLFFQTGLFGVKENEQTFSITAKLADNSNRQKFELTPEMHRVEIFSATP